MSRGEWFLVWTPGHFISAGYTLDIDWAPEGALVYSCMGQPSWWPAMGPDIADGITQQDLDAVLPDTADAELVQAAIEALS